MFRIYRHSNGKRSEAGMVLQQQQEGRCSQQIGRKSKLVLCSASAK